MLINYFIQGTSTTQQMSDMAFFWFLSGMYVAFFLYVILRFFSSNEKIYLIYGAYILLTAIFCFSHNEIYFTKVLNDTFNGVSIQKIIIRFCLPLYSIIYFLFIKKFFNNPSKYPKVYKALSWNIVFLVIHTLALTVLLLANFPTQFEILHRCVNVLCWFTFFPMFYFAFLKLNKLIAFVYFGSIFLFIGAINFSFFEFGIKLLPFPPTKVLAISALLEILIFLIGLGYREYLVNKKLKITQAKNIEVLEQKTRLQNTYEYQLKKEMEAQRIVIKQQQQQQEMAIQFEKQLSEYKLLALRSQMNPHFLFNSLNTLKVMVLTKNDVEIEIYLTQFTNLLRLTLQHSRAEKISLQEELKALKTYIYLEKQRFNKNFIYTTNVAKEVDIYSHTIPPLLIQPLVENAIWHGLRPLENYFPNRIPKLQINIVEKENTLTIEVIDNGVGRTISGKAKKIHKSVANSIISERIELLNIKNPDRNISMLISNLYDYDKKEKIPTGTAVQLIFEHLEKN